MTVLLKREENFQNPSHSHTSLNEKVKDFAHIQICPAESESETNHEGIENHECSENNPYFNIYKSFFNFGYYLGISPFRFTTEMSVTGPRVVLKTSAFAKGLALLCWISSLTYHGIHQRNKILVGSWHSNVLIYFNGIHALMHAATFSLLYLELFCKRNTYVKMMEALLDYDLAEEKDIRKRKTNNRFILIFHILFLVVIPVVGMLEPMERSDWSLEETLKWNVYMGQRYLYLGQYPNQTFPNRVYETFAFQEKFGSMSRSEILLGYLPLLTWFSYSILAGFRLVSFCQAGWTFYGVTKLFVEEAERIFGDQNEAMAKKKERLLQKYQQLKRLASAFNDAWSVSFFFVIIDHTLWLATDLNSGMKEEALTKKFIVCWYFTGVIILVGYASEAVRKMSVFKVWLVEKGHEIFESEKEQQKFLGSLEVNGVWIGKLGVYQFNYSFIGQVLGLVVTFFIITLQSELSNGP